MARHAEQSRACWSYARARKAGHERGAPLLCKSRAQRRARWFAHYGRERGSRLLGTGCAQGLLGWSYCSRKGAATLAVGDQIWCVARGGGRRSAALGAAVKGGGSLHRDKKKAAEMKTKGLVGN